MSESGLWGVAIGTHPRAAERHGVPYPPDMRVVRALGANTVLVPVDWVLSDPESSELQPGPETIGDEELARTIRAAHSAGLTTIVCPIFRVTGGPRGAWRGNIRPADPEAWWQAYRAFVLRYARLAADERAAYFVVGSELSSMSGTESANEWEALTETVRAEFKGQLIYNTNHDALDLRTPFSFVDLAGVSAYFPLADDPDSSRKEMQGRANQAVATIERFSAELQIPVVLLEVGYPSVDGGAVEPWDHTSGAPIDLLEQEMAYDAITRSIEQSERIGGALFWNWLGPGGPNDRHFTPRGKPAEVHLRNLFVARAR